MFSKELKLEILREISRKAYELQIKAGLAQNNKMELTELLTMEKALHHEIKRLRKLIGRYEQAEKKRKMEELEALITAELNYGVN
jgi:hypothetical protein